MDASISFKFYRRVKHHNIPVKIVGEYDQEIPQSQTTDNPMAPRGRAAHHETSGIQIKQSNQLSLPYQDDCNTRIDIT